MTTTLDVGPEGAVVVLFDNNGTPWRYDIPEGEYGIAPTKPGGFLMRLSPLAAYLWALDPAEETGGIWQHVQGNPVDDDSMGPR